MDASELGVKDAESDTLFPPTNGNAAAESTSETPMETIDVGDKIPLDVAILNSAFAAGGDERIRKYLQAMPVIGGMTMLPCMLRVLESRYALSISVASSVPYECKCAL